MKVSDIFDTKNPVHLKAFIFSGLLFFLYSIIVLIDSHGYVKNFNIFDTTQTTRGTLLYAYLATYVIFILKVMLLLLTLFILILIIRIILATVIHIFTPHQQMGGGGINEMRAGAFQDHSNRILEAVYSTMRWMLGFVTSSHFIIIFLIIIPLFLYCSLLAYLYFYNKDNVNKQNKGTSGRIMLTHHHFLMFFITSLLLLAFLFCIYLHLKESRIST